MSLKLIVVGDSGVGKTSFINRLLYDFFNDRHVPTIGVDFKIIKKKTDMGKVDVFIWDTAGQERFNFIVSSYFRGSDGVLICFSLNDNESFDNIKKWLDIVELNCQQDTLIFIIGLKDDIGYNISTQKITDFLKDRRFDYFVISSRKDPHEKLGGIIDIIVSKCIKNKKTAIDSSTIKLMDKKMDKRLPKKKSCF